MGAMGKARYHMHADMWAQDIKMRAACFLPRAHGPYVIR
jgi:hypothetical protein